jgi:hypothetical protein
MELLGRAALVAFAVSTHASGANADGCAPIAFGAAHASLDELAARTLNALFDDGGRFESGGFFIERNGVYHASRPVTQDARRTVNYCIVLPRDGRLAGIYHTHVTSSALSGPDRRNAERAGVPSYIGTIRDRSLWVYDARLRAARLLEHEPPAEIAKDGLPAKHLAGAETSLRERFVALRRRVADALEALSQLF